MAHMAPACDFVSISTDCTPGDFRTFEGFIQLACKVAQLALGLT